MLYYFWCVFEHVALKLKNKPYHPQDGIVIEMNASYPGAGVTLTYIVVTPGGLDLARNISIVSA